MTPAFAATSVIILWPMSNLFSKTIKFSALNAPTERMPCAAVDATSKSSQVARMLSTRVVPGMRNVSHAATANSP
ncbi:unnamed protein product [Staurois parvus]|uniref:Secreted protein n=1 Tax=Staurois parvus TaxID=386267 RepID=A0ABN9H6W2_9NEOB|nr:unnamed protein product [Staurois parvus]